MAISELQAFTEFAIKEQAANIAAAFAKYERIQNDESESDDVKRSARERFYDYFAACILVEESKRRTRADVRKRATEYGKERGVIKWVNTMYETAWHTSI